MSKILKVKLLEEDSEPFLADKSELISPDSLSNNLQYGDIVYGLYYDDNSEQPQILSTVYPCIIIQTHSKNDLVKVQFFGEFAYRHVQRQFLFKVEPNTKTIKDQ